jgi:hypothetical protein
VRIVELEEVPTMTIFLWVAALRVLAALLIVSVIWPGLLEPRRWAGLNAPTDTRRTAK